MSDIAKEQAEWVAKGSQMARDNFQRPDMSEDEIKPVAFDGSELRHGCVQRPKRWSGDTHDDLGGSVDEAATDALMAAAADAIDRLTAEMDRMRIIKSQDSDHVSFCHAEIDRLTAERDAALASRDRYWDERDEAQRKLSVAVASGNALVADAERYRWLCDNCQEIADYYATAGQLYFGTYGYGGIDAAIDAARAEGGV